MGRVGEVIIRTWQTAHKMKVQRGWLADPQPAGRGVPDGNARHDNFRVKRYIAKYTINPAITQGIAHVVGSHRGRQARRPGALEAGVLRRQAEPDPQGRHDRRGRDGRPEREHPDAAAGALPADVRRLRRAMRQHVPDLRLEGRAGRRRRRRSSACSARVVAVENTRTHRQEGHGPQRRHAATSRSTRRPTRCASTASC